MHLNCITLALAIRVYHQIQENLSIYVFAEFSRQAF